jgi:magnesium chelatase family protein
LLASPRGIRLEAESGVLAQVLSAALVGIDALPVSVEADVAFGLPVFAMVGLPDASVRESRDRVRAAIRNSGFDFPAHRITVNLSPADVRKAGAAFDLPIAVAILAAAGAVPRLESGRIAIVGELSLDGAVLPTRGVLPIAAGLRRLDVPVLMLPAANAPEATVVRGVRVVPVRTLADAVACLSGDPASWPAAPPAGGPFTPSPGSVPDLADTRGQAAAKRALEIAAAGGHHVLLVGPPGTGKTMLARRLPGLLPPLGFDEALDATAVHSVAGLLPAGAGLLPERPFRAPHHTCSEVALVGGGSLPRPGEISLAHHGVLFLDELPEFPRRTIEVLRQPIEEGRIRIARAAGSVTFPAAFTLVAAMNPCPCGYHGHPSRPCRCTPIQVQQYQGRLSGPLRDRLDLAVEVAPIPLDTLYAPPGESSATVRERVAAARSRQRERGAALNARLPVPALSKAAALDAAGARCLAEATTRLGLSARAVHRLLRVARTVADLDRAGVVTADHIAEAAQYRHAVGLR